MNNHKSGRFRSVFMILNQMWVLEVCICISYFCLGCWKFWTGWNNSMHVGWTQGGAVYILGSLGCIWLACIRRKPVGMLWDTSSCLLSWRM